MHDRTTALPGPVSEFFGKEGYDEKETRWSEREVDDETKLVTNQWRWPRDTISYLKTKLKIIFFLRRPD